MLKRESCWSECNGINYDRIFFSILQFVLSFFFFFVFDLLSLFFFLLIFERIIICRTLIHFRGQSSFALNFQLLRYFFIRNERKNGVILIVIIYNKTIRII